MSKVALLRCESYNYEEVKEAVKRGFELLGGAHKFCRPKEKILLKPNILIGDVPEKCATTHPAVVKAVAELLLEAGVKVSYGDSPAIGSPLNAAKKCGIHQAAEELGVELADFENGEDVTYAGGSQNKKFYLAKGVLASDGLISLPKLKTHGFQKMTGSIKNQFGCIPGTLKAVFHTRITDPIQFARMLVDLDMAISPRLYIMDGIMAMEGNGPRGGTPKAMNIILMSDDAIALDATVCRLINLEPSMVPTITQGEELGHGHYSEEKIELIGDSLESFKDSNFKVDKREVRPFPGVGMAKALAALLVPKPIILDERCIRCGICIDICPVEPKAVNWDKGDKSRPPVYKYRDCIRCYCCQELCPEKAIELKSPFLRRIFSKKSR